MAASLLVLAVVAPVVAGLMTAWSQGWTLAGVQTGSMRPGLRPGSMVVVGPARVAEIEQGDVIAFRDDRRSGAVTAHRVVEVLEQRSGRFFRTQGDANPRPDGQPVPAAAVVGEVRWRVAGLGALAEAATNPSVQLGLIAAPAVLLAASELAGLRGRRSGRIIRSLQEEVARLEGELAASRVAAADGCPGPSPTWMHAVRASWGWLTGAR